MDLSPSATGHCLPLLMCRLQCEKFMVQAMEEGRKQTLLLTVYCFLLAEPALVICTKIPPRTDDFAINTTLPTLC